MATKKQRGRPAKPMIQQIDATPEEIAQAVLSVPFDEIKPILEQIEREEKSSE